MSDPIVRKISIVNKRGLHARASAKFVNCVESYEVDVRVSKDGHHVIGNSIMGLMMLGASEGSIITVSALGSEAAPFLEALESLIENKFGETE